MIRKIITGDLSGFSATLFASACIFASYLYNQVNTKIGVTFMALFLLSLLCGSALLILQGKNIRQLIHRAFKSRIINMSALLALTALILYGVIPAGVHATISWTFFAAGILALFVGCIRRT